MTGHGAADAEDLDGRLLCAAVSSAAYLTANTLTDITGASAEIGEDDGRMEITLISDPAPCQDILRGLRLHLTALAGEYEKRIKVITEV